MNNIDPVWFERLDNFVQRYASLLNAFASSNVNFPLACLICVVGLMTIAAWPLLSSKQSHRFNWLIFCAFLLLTSLPATWFFSILSREGLNLTNVKRESWSVIERLYFSLRYQTDFFKSIAIEQQYLFIALSFLAAAALTAGLILVQPKGRIVKFITLTLICAFSAAPIKHFAQNHTYAHAVAQERATGLAIFDEKCKIAGIKRHKSAQDAGIRLTGLRIEAPDTRNTDRDWQGAGIAQDRVGQAYIYSFLDFEFYDSGMQKAWNVATFPGRVTMMGFQYVDVLQENGSYLRYRRLSDDLKIAPSVETISPEQAARYAVNYTSNDAPQDRLHWVAGATVTVSDTSTDEVIGELKAFSHVSTWRSTAERSRKIDSSKRDWELAKTCPEYQDIPRAMVRMFVEQIVRPAR